MKRMDRCAAWCTGRLPGRSLGKSRRLSPLTAPWPPLVRSRPLTHARMRAQARPEGCVLLATGASGGVAAESRVIAPQFVPVSQVVLVALKCSRELKLGGA